MGTKPAKRKVGHAGQKVRAKPGSKATPEQAAAVAKGLAKEYADAECALTHRNAFQLLIATILSAQCTDQRVNMVTPELFKKWPTPEDLAQVDFRELEKVIQSTGFFRNKAKNILGCCQKLVEEHGGEVPRTLEELVKLPGIGRKTANVVLGHALGVPGLPVDRHVLRVANRIGIADSEDPIAVEQQLCGRLPPERWTRASDALILHGRRICRPKPLCDQCFVVDDCDYYRLVVSRERSVKAKPKLKSKPKTQKGKPKAVGKKPVRKARR